jgi:hypothetical protein
MVSLGVMFEGACITTIYVSGSVECEGRRKGGREGAKEEGRWGVGNCMNIFLKPSQLQNSKGFKERCQSTGSLHGSTEICSVIYYYYWGVLKMFLGPGGPHAGLARGLPPPSHYFQQQDLLHPNHPHTVDQNTHSSSSDKTTERFALHIVQQHSRVLVHTLNAYPHIQSHVETNSAILTNTIFDGELCIPPGRHLIDVHGVLLHS